MKNLVLYSLLCLVLHGCAKDVVTITKTETRYSVLEKSWLLPCPIASPPAMEQYLNADLQTQRDLWAAAYTGQVKSTVDCNARLEQASKYNEDNRTKSTVTSCVNGSCK